MTPLRIGLIACIAFALAFPAIAQEKPAPNPSASLDEDTLAKNLKAGLGDSFLFVSAEWGAAEVFSNAGDFRRFWFARVRAEKAGRFELRITVTHEDEDREPAKTVYTIPLQVGERGKPRIVLAGVDCGIAAPLASEGDSITLPIHIRKGGTAAGFKFQLRQARHAHSYDDLHRAFMIRAAGEAVVELKGDAGRAGVLATQARAYSEYPGAFGGGIANIREVYFECVKTGQFNLAGDIEFTPDGKQSIQRHTAAVRVVDRDKPILVMARAVTVDTGFPPASIVAGDYFYVPSGTHEVRQGDRIQFQCARVNTRGRDANPGRKGFMQFEEFKEIEAYAAVKAGAK